MNKFELKNYEIISKDSLTHDTFLFRLKGKIAFKPGQFLRVVLDHFGEIVVAPCSDPRNTEWFEICVRAAGSTSNAIANLLPGDNLGVRGPYGNSWPVQQAKGKELILIAGGLGLVPLRPLLYELGRKKNKRVKLFVGFRSAENAVFVEDLETWGRNINVFAVAEFTVPRSICKKGLITEPLEKEKINKESIVFICGPEVMVPFCIDKIHQKDIGDDQIFLSMERRMECGIGICQHCNIGKYMVCKDGPVFRYDRIIGEIGK